MTTDSALASHNKTTMFYDGGCPLCSREVAHYQRIDVHNNVLWLDIHKQPEVLEAYGLKYIAAMKHLHVKDSDGKMLTGAYAFQALWKALPRYRVLARLVSFPGILRVMDKAYEWFAERRFEKRMACASSGENVKQNTCNIE